MSLPNSKWSIVKSRGLVVKANYLILSILDIEKESGMCFQIHRICTKDMYYIFSKEMRI